MVVSVRRVVGGRSIIARDGADNSPHRLPRHLKAVRSARAAAAEGQSGVSERTSGSFSASRCEVVGRNGRTDVLTVRGEIDISTAPLLRDVLRPVLEHRTGPVVVDLSDVPFMDSTGLHILVETHRQLVPHERPLAIACRENGQVHRLLALVGVLDALTVHRSRESAVSGGQDVIRPERDVSAPPPRTR